MIERSLEEIAKMLGSNLEDENFKDVLVKGVSTDSRTIEENNLYIPLVGEVFDGRLFIKECQDKGASAFLIDRDTKIKNNIDIPYIRVDDTLKALQNLAKAYRKDLISTKVIGITGSNGKTTSKDLIYEVLNRKYKCQKTIGNLNNEIGVPKTILSLDSDCEVAIVELGTDNFGDISLTTDIARPDIAIITNIGDSHLEKLKTKEGIAKAKMEIIEALNPNGKFIYNGDDPILNKVVKNYDINADIITFGQDENVDFKVLKEKNDGLGVSFSCHNNLYKVPLLGEHNIYNGSLAVLIGEIFKLDYSQIKEGLAQVTPANNRSQILEFDGFDVLDDSYKSNPQSLISGLSTCKMLSGYANKIVVLGDMLELGEDEASLHYDVGTKIDQKDIHYCLFFGPLSKHMHEGSLTNFPKNRSFHFANKDDLIEKLKSLISKSTLVFVKGSHGMHMEEIIESIKKLKV